jgi:hypothetical protein
VIQLLLLCRVNKVNMVIGVFRFIRLNRVDRFIRIIGPIRLLELSGY